jgi:hypothetical protein
LEVEVETNKQKSKENLQQALLIERERYTQMQWDMEELRRQSMEMELKLKSEQVIYLSTILFMNLYIFLNYYHLIDDIWNDTRMKSHMQS